MSSKYEILMWAEGVIAKKNGPPHLVLELKETASLDEVQAAFHKVARTAHPDLHRNVLTPDELEQLTSAYAAVAGAYMQMRSTASQTQKKGISKDEAPSPPHRPTPIPAGTGRTPPVGTPVAPPPSSGEGITSLSSADAAQQMSQKAVLYFRKAEMRLKTGDLKGALLQIKLAIAADPHSTFLRNALAEVDAELRRTT